jgi:predicted nucleic acid-binding protein
LIAADTSSMSAFLAGDAGLDAELVADALRQGQLVLPPVVLSELLSSTRLRRGDAAALVALPLIPIGDGYWERVGALRSGILRRRLKSRLADALIAQSCIDAALPLIARDHDFRHYTTAGLRLRP